MFSGVVEAAITFLTATIHYIGFAAMPRLSQTALVAAVTAGTAYAGSIADIDHVVLFMQENRAFDHYFGTMASCSNSSQRCSVLTFRRLV
jgi:phospholipase C